MPVDPRGSQFWRAAMRSGLIDATALQACLEAIPPEKRTPEALDRRLARQAVVTGRLTPWQARQLQLGRWKALKIGKYNLLDLVGQGGMGQVYRARDTRLGRDVAIKVLSRQRSLDPRAVARFEREARIAGQLRDEHLIRVYDEGEAFGFRFLVMEFIEGLSAAQLLEVHGPLPPAAVAELVRQVALGLESLHGQGLLHRDVTPANILVDRGGTARLTDLGLAVDPAESSKLTVDGATLGTFDYLSPEQARDPRRIDLRSDLYSLGCSAYHLLAGQVPFPAPALPEKLLAHRASEAEPISVLVASCPPGLDAVIHRMMRKSPEDRYARAADVAAALAPFASGPASLARIVAMAEESVVGAAGGGAAEETYPAEWFRSDSETGNPGETAAPRADADLQEVFVRVDLAPTPPVSEEPPAGSSRLPAAGLFALVGLALLAIGFAIALALLPR